MVKQLPRKEKIRLSKELGKEAIDTKLSRLLKTFRNDLKTITEEVESVRKEIYDRKNDETMTIKEIKEELKVAKHPIAKSLHHGTGFKVLILGFTKGMILKEHKAHIPSKLTVLEGSVIYKEENRVMELIQYDEVEIPIAIMHSVEAMEDSLCILSQGE